MSGRALRIGIICIVVSVLGFAIRNNFLDDALIYARYVRNALGGHGLVFNQGEPINALTSPLLGILLLSVSALMHGHILVAEQVISICFLAGACILAEQFAAWAGVLLASVAYFYLCFGMETPLFLFLIALTIQACRKNRWEQIPLLVLLTALTRFEGGLLGVAIAYDMYRRRAFPGWRAWLLPVIVVAAYLFGNFHFYGHLMPASASAKFGQGFSGYWGRWPRAFLTMPRPLHDTFQPTLYAVPLVVLFGLVGVYKSRATALNRILLPTLGGMLAFYVLFNIPNYHWYDAPFIFFAVVFAVIGLPQTRVSYALLAVLILHSSFTAFLALRLGAGIREYAQMGEWIQKHSAPQAKVAASEIGTIGWYCNRNVDDILGLTNPKNASHLSHHDLDAWLAEDKPDYVVVHDPPWYGEGVATASALYVSEPVHFGRTFLLRRRVSGEEPLAVATPALSASPKSSHRETLVVGLAR